MKILSNLFTFRYSFTEIFIKFSLHQAAQRNLDLISVKFDRIDILQKNLRQLFLFLMNQWDEWVGDWSVSPKISRIFKSE